MDNNIATVLVYASEDGDINIQEASREQLITIIREQYDQIVALREQARQDRETLFSVFAK